MVQRSTGVMLIADMSKKMFVMLNLRKRDILAAVNDVTVVRISHADLKAGEKKARIE